jgi:hypothetical protein
MSFQLAIPWRIALQQGPLRFASRRSFCAIVVLPVDSFLSDGQQCLNCLSQLMGPPQSDSESGALTHQKYLLHDCDTKFCSCFTATLSDGSVQPLRLPARSPNLNAFAERWVRSVKQECLSKLILFSEASLKRVLAEYLAHYHTERNHQGKRNLLLFPAPVDTSSSGKPILCKQRLGGLLKYYARAA